MSAAEMLLNTLKSCFLLKGLAILTALQLNDEHWKTQADLTGMAEATFRYCMTFLDAGD